MPPDCLLIVMWPRPRATPMVPSEFQPVATRSPPDCRRRRAKRRRPPRAPPTRSARPSSATSSCRHALPSSSSLALPSSPSLGLPSSPSLGRHLGLQRVAAEEAAARASAIINALRDELEEMRMQMRRERSEHAEAIGAAVRRAQVRSPRAGVPLINAAEALSSSSPVPSPPATTSPRSCAIRLLHRPSDAPRAPRRSRKAARSRRWRPPHARPAATPLPSPSPSPPPSPPPSLARCMGRLTLRARCPSCTVARPPRRTRHGSASSRTAATSSCRAP